MSSTPRPPVRRASARPSPAPQAPAPAPAPPRRHVREAVVRTTVAHKSPATHGEWQTTRDEEVRTLAEALADAPHVGHVRVGGGVTLGRGNFEFIRIDQSVELPCLPSIDGEHGINETQALLTQKVREFIDEEISLANGQS